MSERRRQQRPRPETIAAAKARARAAGSLVGGSDVEPEYQVTMLKGLCRYLWGLLDRRRGVSADTPGIPDPFKVFDDLTEFGMAAVDRTFEASLVLLGRDRIYVEPCRRILDHQLDGDWRYLLIYPNGGEQRVVTEAELIAMAGV